MGALGSRLSGIFIWFVSFLIGLLASACVIRATRNASQYEWSDNLNENPILLYFVRFLIAVAVSGVCFCITSFPLKWLFNREKNSDESAA